MFARVFKVCPGESNSLVGGSCVADHVDGYKTFLPNLNPGGKKKGWVRSNKDQKERRVQRGTYIIIEIKKLLINVGKFA